MTGETLIATSSALAFEQLLLTAPTLDLSSMAPQVAAPAPAPRSPIERLPTEIHLLILARLDPLDRTILGLTSRTFYAVWQLTLPRLHPSPSYPGGSPPQSITRLPPPLSTRRIGKNELEYAYNRQTAGFRKCRFCGEERCVLWRHLEEWFPAQEWEFCGVRERFARRVVGGQGCDEGCWRSCPPMPRRCGRHGRGEGEQLKGEMSRL